MANEFCPVVANGSAQGYRARGVTPLPAVAWVRRIESPAVKTTWAWCMSRSTVGKKLVDAFFVARRYIRADLELLDDRLPENLDKQVERLVAEKQQPLPEGLGSTHGL